MTRDIDSFSLGTSDIPIAFIRDITNAHAAILTDADITSTHPCDFCFQPVFTPSTHYIMECTHVHFSSIRGDIAAALPTMDSPMSLEWNALSTRSQILCLTGVAPSVIPVEIYLNVLFLIHSIIIISPLYA